jgi:hypothetical protein
MRTAKYILALVLLATQGVAFVGIFVEFFVRSFQIPYFFGSLYLLRCGLMVWLKDSSGEVLFSVNRLSRFGFIYYHSFDILKRLK